MSMNRSKIKVILREEDMPMFSDEQISEFVAGADTPEDALYELLLLKSENTSFSISGLSVAETSDYFRRLAATYRPHNTGSLGGE